MRRRALLLLGLVALAGTACRAPAAPEDAFTRRVAERLREQQPGMGVVVKERFHLQTTTGDGGHNDVYLDNLWRECQMEGADCDEAIGRHLRLSAQLGTELASYVKAETVRALLKDRQWLANVRGMVKEGPAEKARENELVSRPFAADMFVVYVFDMPDGMRMISRGEMEKLKLDEEGLHALAVTNLEASLPALASAPVEPGSAIRVVHEGDSYEASRLLLHARWEPIARQVKGELTVAAPTRDYVFFTGSREDVAGLRALVRQASAEGGHPLSVSLLRWTKTGWEAVP